MIAFPIVPAGAEHHAAIRAMATEVVADGSVFVYEQVDRVLDYWFAADTAVFVATDGDAVVGTYAIKPNQPDRGAHVANAGYMVATAHRGRGVGRVLGEHSIGMARRLGYRSMQFNMVVATNPAAVHLWTALGFRIAGTLPAVFRHPDGRFVDAHVMVRDLGE